MMNCPNCGGELVSKLEAEDLEAPIEPEGGILVCANCRLAVDPNEDEESVAYEAPAPGEGEEEPQPEQPARVEDEIRIEPLFPPEPDDED